MPFLGRADRGTILRYLCAGHQYPRQLPEPSAREDIAIMDPLHSNRLEIGFPFIENMLN